jgi:hypothetical protein
MGDREEDGRVMARIIPSDKQTDWHLHCHTCGDQRLTVCLQEYSAQPRWRRARKQGRVAVRARVIGVIRTR